VTDVESPVEADDADEPRPRKSMPIILAVVAVAAIVGGLVWVLGSSEPAANRVADSPLVGRQAPPIAGTTLTGDQFDMAQDEAGKWVLVNFFAQWCVPCQQEHDDLVRFDDRHRQVGDAAVVSVVYDDDADDVRTFFDEHGGSFPVITSDKGDIALDYGVAKVPESYLVDPAGTVVAKIIGGITEDGLEDLLARFVGSG
jgi:cytochrome c biogenesis protein CcmG/thiol:disulfide interchange protein DsbE